MAARGTFGTAKKRATFLVAIAKGLGVEQAAELIGAGRRTVYNWRRGDEAFRRDWDAAIDACTDRLEARLQELALEGDVTALIFMLKARKPEIYNPNLLLRQQMLQVALERARAEARASTLVIESDSTNNIHFYMPKNGRDEPEPDEPEPPTINVSNPVTIEGPPAVELPPVVRVIETVTERQPPQRKPPVDPVLRVWGKM